MSSRKAEAVLGEEREDKRDKLSLDLFWLRDESLEGTDNLPPPAEIAASIVEDLRNALEQFMAIAEDLGGKANGDTGSNYS